MVAVWRPRQQEGGITYGGVRSSPWCDVFVPHELIMSASASGLKKCVITYEQLAGQVTTLACGHIVVVCYVDEGRPPSLVATSGRHRPLPKCLVCWAGKRTRAVGAPKWV